MNQIYYLNLWVTSDQILAKGKNIEQLCFCD